ncbi:hypothetical protein NDU88_001722 [Pleurodeles waltl]|uniref:Uncharacterized protein n=1 Tax=Pleurodeles waltl TaxID=8319 RepID=A0AAV7P814_PLEWA|nr:hypothetical protein NDU88_001722 [Pleurodeles waltl]
MARPPTRLKTGREPTLGHCDIQGDCILGRGPFSPIPPYAKGVAGKLPRGDQGAGPPGGIGGEGLPAEPTESQTHLEETLNPPSGPSRIQY